jgi:1-deoxyxylulose-5-phosphate synthase
MKYGTIEGIKQPVSRAVMGSMIFSPENRKLTYELLDEFVKLGGNCIDTAHVYGGGKSEVAIGLWMKERGNRDKILILDKGCHPYHPRPTRVTPEDIRADLKDNLQRLDTNYIDMWVFHRDNPEVPVAPLCEELNTHIAAGKIRAIGASNWSHTRIQEFNEYAQKKGLKGFVLSSPNLSLAVPKEVMWAGSITVSPDAMKWHEKKQFPLFAWSSQARGFFSGRYAPDVKEGDNDVIRCYYTPQNFERLKRAQELGKEKGLSAIQVAFAYVMHQPFPTYCLIGPANLDELRSSVGALDLALTPDEIKWLEA